MATFLPAAQMPRNAMLNFQPLNDAIDDYQAAARNAEQETYNRQQNAEIMGMRRQEFAGQQQDRDDRRRATRVQQLAGLAQFVDSETDPAVRAQRWSALVQSDPRLSSMLPEQFRDPVNGPKYLMAEARGYLNPLDEELKRAQIEKARREASGQSVDYGKTGSVFQGQDGKFYTIQFGSNGTRRIEPVEVGGQGLAPARGVQVVGDEVISSATGGTVRNVGGNLTAGKAAEAVGAATVKSGVDAWEGYGKLQSNIANMDEAITALDNGAQSGIVYNMLPSVTEASASLQNAMDRMGLDVIGSVTFGALSEGELRLAMDTAVPRNLAPPELRNWLVQKREAQRKAATMLADAAQYLTVPGNSINGWIEKNRAARSGSGPQPGTGASRGGFGGDQQPPVQPPAPAGLPQVPSGGGPQSRAQDAPQQQTMTARNPQTGQTIVSPDGRNWYDPQTGELVWRAQ